MRLLGRDIICISSIDWDFIWQGHQEIMTTLSRQGNRVLFVENTGVRSPKLRDLPRVRHRLRNWWRNVSGFREEMENLFVYSPVVLPFPYSRSARWVNRRILGRALRCWMRATGFQRPIVWTFLPTPLVRDLIRELDPELTVYYCIDDLAQSSPGARRIADTERKVLAEVDLVFVTSEKLRRHAERIRPDVHLFPFGVSYARFEEVRKGGDELPDDLARLSRPVAGYVGGLHQWVDQTLLAEAAKRLPDVSFALVGPPQTDLSALSAQPNVHLLGPRPHRELPGYIKGFDVGLVPYRLTEYTAGVYPTKLNEYLAMGIPVVATALPEIEGFNTEHGRVVNTVAPDPAAFADAIRAEIGRSTPEDRQRRIVIAAQNSWDSRVDRMTALIDRALARRRSTGETWEARLRRLYRHARRRVAVPVALMLAAYLLVFQTPLVWVAAEPLKVATAAEPADAIVVLGGGVGETGRDGQGYKERVRHAVDLYRAGHAPAIVFSSGYRFAFQEVTVMKELAVSSGVPSSAILLEPKAASTRDYVLFVRRILDERGWRRILLVSSPYHMRRATLTWKRLAPDITVVPTPVPYSEFYTRHRGTSAEQLKAVLQEYAGIAVYWWRGWIG